MKQRLTDIRYESSLGRGLRILESFTDKARRLSPSEIQRMADIPKATVFRLLRILKELNYLRYNPETKKYHPGPRCLSLGFSVLQSMEIREIARPHMEQLSRDCNRSINLLMLDGQHMVFIERIRVPGLRTFNISIGSRISVHNSASGKAVLAYLGHEKYRRIIEEISKDHRISREIGKNGAKLHQRLKAVESSGFAINDGEMTRMLLAIAAPIFSNDGVSCALDLVVAPEEISIDELSEKYAPKLIKTCRQISEELGWQGGIKTRPDF